MGGIEGQEPKKSVKSRTCKTKKEGMSAETDVLCEKVKGGDQEIAFTDSIYV